MKEKHCDSCKYSQYIYVYDDYFCIKDKFTCEDRAVYSDCDEWKGLSEKEYDDK